MDSDSKSTKNQKNEPAPSPNYNWKDITPEFFDCIKGTVIWLWIDKIWKSI